MISTTTIKQRKGAMTQKRCSSIGVVLLLFTTIVQLISGFTVPQQQQLQRQQHIATHSSFESRIDPLSKLSAHKQINDNDNENAAASKRCPFLRTLASTAGEATASAAQSKLQQTSLPPSSSSSSSQEKPSVARSFFTKLDDLYTRSSKLKCPFWRRRAADTIDSAATILRFLLVRHKSLGIFDPFFYVDDDDTINLVLNEEKTKGSVVPGCKPVGHLPTKHRHLDVGTIASIIEQDWTDALGRDKGYYITGRLNSTIYRDDCLFDGPDPDMPVRGLRKYLSAASHLFDGKRSFAQLLSITHNDVGGFKGKGVVEVQWRLGGVLMLPWRPIVKPWTGMTRYHLDESGLIYYHEEMWDISVLEAFVCTVWPELGERIWGPPGSITTTDSVI